MKQLFKILSALSLALSSFLYNPALAAKADGSFKIRLAGEIAENTAKRISISDIEAIGTAEVNAFNPYEKKSDDYTGVWLDEFVAHFGKPGVSMISLSAIDDYTIDFSSDEWNQIRIMVATRVNGKYIGYDEKGPMRIVFPDFDPNQEIYQDILPKWMWMINKVTFK